MVLVLSLVALVLVIGLSVRNWFRALHESEEEARRARLVRACEREMRRLSGDRP